MSHIEVLTYDPRWPERFAELAGLLNARLAGFSIRIEHVGSTAVPGLWAKPILDIDVIADAPEERPALIEALETLGYMHRGEMGIPRRDAFARRDDSVPYAGGRTWMDHHLYLVDPECDALRNHLLLRDHLRSHPEAAREYSRLKVKLAERFPEDIDAYIDGKTALIARLLEESGMDLAAVAAIRALNEKSESADGSVGRRDDG